MCVSDKVLFTVFVPLLCLYLPAEPFCSCVPYLYIHRESEREEREIVGWYVVKATAEESSGLLIISGVYLDLFLEESAVAPDSRRMFLISSAHFFCSPHPPTLLHALPTRRTFHSLHSANLDGPSSLRNNLPTHNPCGSGHCQGG
ncbi:hypothetical protein CEXT_41021 [Caerostris extrusa]|uniref:Uncharacterized protein n=1 Tax=Caerostris extrusa TaxID=172846 RepID=A0AAV4QD39_CAEEX|nr:hypothetical protein CEXT_41021 [Caerostris extrusa]